MRITNAQSGRRVSITVDGTSSWASVVSGSWIVTLTVRAQSSSRNANRSITNDNSVCGSTSASTSAGMARQ